MPRPPLTEEQKDKLGVRKWFMAPADIGESAALKLCGQLLDDSRYDLLVDQTGIVETPDFEPLAILLKGRLPQDLLMLLCLYQYLPWIDFAVLLLMPSSKSLPNCLNFIEFQIFSFFNKTLFFKKQD